MKSTDSTVIIPNNKWLHENLLNYNVYSINKTKLDVERKNKLCNIILNKTFNFTKDTIEVLIDEYNDIFALESDKMTQSMSRITDFHMSTEKKLKSK